MRILVTGAGRGGTSLVREIVRGLNIVTFSSRMEEDRHFFKYETLPKQYGTKLTTENKGFTLENIIKMMKKYGDLKVIFSLRNPIDNCMSKIVRGQRSSRGGDSAVEKISPDATIKGAIAAVKYAREIYREISNRFPDRVYKILMEDLILHPEREVNKIAAFLGTKTTKGSLEFYKHNTNHYQNKRYGQHLDGSQINLYKRWSEIYGGFFKDWEKDINQITRSFK